MTDYEQVRRRLMGKSPDEIRELCQDFKVINLFKDCWKQISADKDDASASLTVTKNLLALKDKEPQEWRELCIALRVRTDEGTAIIRSRQAVCISAGAFVLSWIAIAIAYFK